MRRRPAPMRASPRSTTRSPTRSARARRCRAPDVRAARKADLDREIVGARAAVGREVHRDPDDTDDARRQLVVSVRIDRDKLRARLAELNIATARPALAVATGTAKTAAVLVRVTMTGSAGSPGPTRSDLGVPALTGALRAAGIVVRRPRRGPTATSTTRPRHSSRSRRRPRWRSSPASASARSCRCAASPQPAALVTAKVRMLDKGKPVGQGTAIAAARGEDTTGYAVDRALTAAIRTG